MNRSTKVFITLLLFFSLCGCGTTPKQEAASVTSPDTSSTPTTESSNPQSTPREDASGTQEQPASPTDAPVITRKNTDDGRVIEVHTHANGDYSEHYYTSDNVLESTVDHFADGHRAEIRYNQGEVISEAHYNPANILERSVDYHSDGHTTEVLYDEVGKQTEANFYDQNGNLERYSHFTYHENGCTEIEYDAVTNNLVSEHEYGVEGNLIKTSMHSPDGIIEVFYSASGAIDHEAGRRPNGVHWEKYYTSSGSVEYEYSDQGSITAMTEFGTDHTKQRVCRYDPETGDLQSEEKYDGDILVSHWFTDRYADWDTLDTYKNGVRVQRELLWHAGSDIDLEVISCDAHGTLVSGKKVFSNGTYWLTFYTADSFGEYINYMECYNSTGTLTETWSGTSRTDLGTWTRPAG